MLALYASSPSGINGMAIKEYRAADFADSSSFNHHLNLPSLQQQKQQEDNKVAELHQSPPLMTITSDPTVMKKLTHNAKERDRRKKINGLDSSLRSLLPAADQMVTF